MSSQILNLLILGACAIASLVFYARFFSTFASGKARHVNIIPYKLADACVAGGLTLWFLMMVASGAAKPSQELTLSTIIVGSAVYGSILLFVVGFQTFANNNPMDAYGLQKLHVRSAFVRLLCTLPLLYLAREILVQYVFPENTENQGIVLFLEKHHDPRSLLIVGFLVIIVAPLTEELVFRGYLYGVVSHYFGRWAGMLFSAVLFAAIHNHLPSALPLFLLAVSLTLAYESTGSLWTPILMHAGFNALSFSMLVWCPQMPL